MIEIGPLMQCRYRMLIFHFNLLLLHFDSGNINNLNFGIRIDLFLQRALIPALQPKKKKDHIDHDWSSCSIKGQKRGLHMQEMGGM